MIKYSGISTLEVLEGAENYNSWIASRIKPYSKSPILEVGAGSGNITKFFINTKHFTASDIDKGLVAHLKERYKKKINFKVLDIEKTLPKNIESSFKSIFAVNVLEHIKNDTFALKNMNKLLVDSGKIVLLVPANKFAFTRLDKELGHFRRYSKNELTQKVTSAGFEIESIKFFNIVGLATWILRDLIEKENIQLNSYQIALFDKIVPILRFIESKISIPIGISLIIVARKSKNI